MQKMYKTAFCIQPIKVSRKETEIYMFLLEIDPLPPPLDKVAPAPAACGGEEVELFLKRGRLNFERTPPPPPVAPPADDDVCDAVVLTTGSEGCEQIKVF